MKKIYMKWWAWGIVVVLVVGVWFLFGSEKNPSYDFDKKQSDLYQQELSNLVEKQKQDTYGGDTPQETWDMFVSALEDGDVDLASKYFVVDKQEEARGEFSSLNEEQINLYMDVLSYENSGELFDNKKLYDINFYDSAGNQVHFERLILNEYTNKWKIESL